MPRYDTPRTYPDIHQPARRQNFRLRHAIDDILVLCRPHQGRAPVMPLAKARHELVELNTPTPVIERLVVGYIDYAPPPPNRRVARLELEFAQLVAHRVQMGDMSPERARELLAEHRVPVHIIEQTLGD